MTPASYAAECVQRFQQRWFPANHNHARGRPSSRASGAIPFFLFSELLHMACRPCGAIRAHPLRMDGQRAFTFGGIHTARANWFESCLLCRQHPGLKVCW